MQGDLAAHLDPILTGANMKALWTNAGRPRPDDDDLQQSLWRVCSEFFSRPLSVAWAMRLFNILPYSKPLTIHLVGAANPETLAAKVTDFDELNNMFPGHQGIEVVMVGPEVVDGPIMRPPLRAFGPRQRVYISAYRGLYHEFWEELVEKEEAAKPDLVVGFNPGENTFSIIKKRKFKKRNQFSFFLLFFSCINFFSLRVKGLMPARAWTRDGFPPFCCSGIMRFLLCLLLSSECHILTRCKNVGFYAMMLQFSI